MLRKQRQRQRRASATVAPRAAPVPPDGAYHPAGTRCRAGDAPSAPRRLPCNRCDVGRCVSRGRPFPRDQGRRRHFIDERIRAPGPRAIVDARASAGSPNETGGPSHGPPVR
jgi:hypothetical protein